MITIETIHEIIGDFQERRLPDLTRRLIDLSCPANKIRVLVGARRVGKTYSFYQLIQDLQAQGVPREQILFINFEDERLMPLELADLTRIFNTYYEIYPAHKDQDVYLFFDEIQNVPQWEVFIRRIHEQERVHINLTGSSSKLMSSDIASKLRGRTLAFEIFPFNFREYLQHKNIGMSSSSKNRAFIVNAFNSYLFSGGYPEILEVNETFRIKILQSYFDLLLYKDLVERYEIRNSGLMKYLLKYLLANNANPISVNKIFSDLKSQGFRVSKDTLHSYLSYLEDARCLSLVSIYSESIRKQQIHYRKVYFIDHGLVTSLVPSQSYNRGRLLETMVYNHLRHQFSREQIFYYKTRLNREVDFLIRTQGQVRWLLQVCESTENVATQNREGTALFQALEELSMDQATIITRHDSGQIEQNGKLIQVVPFWRWIAN
ncbi:ATP-binding protein [candidate division KSB1 bacterium]|nr:ATP-binding protein [candidate division KSB1 bacterium]